MKSERKRNMGHRLAQMNTDKKIENRARRRPIKQDYGTAGMRNAETKGRIEHRSTQMNTDKKNWKQAF